MINKNTPVANAAPAVEVRAQSATPRPEPRSLQMMLGFLPLLLGFQLLVWVVYLPVALAGNADFRNEYAAGMILRSGRGHELYDYKLQREVESASISVSTEVLPYVHLPYEALLFAPLSLLPYREAYLCFLALNLICFWACGRLLRQKLWRLNQMWGWFPFLMMASFMPVAAALMQGQDSLVTVLLMSASLLSIATANHMRAGFLIGFALFKFQIVLPIVLLFLIWRRWRFLCGACVSILIALVTSILISGSGSLAQYIRSLREISTKFEAGGQVLYVMPVGRMPNLRGLSFSLLHSRSVAEIVVVVASLIVVGLAAWAGRKSPAPWQLAIAITTAALVGYHVLTHDLSMMLVPTAMLLDQRDARGLWNIPALWLATPLCFLAYDYLAVLPMLSFFTFLIHKFVDTSANRDLASSAGRD